MAKTEPEFFLERTKKRLIGNCIKLLILLVVASVCYFFTRVYWGTPYIVFTLTPALFCTLKAIIFLFRIRRNIKDYRDLSEIVEYSNSLQVQSMELKEDD